MVLAPRSSSYAMSLLSRVAAIGYPLVLLILDVFPLRRLDLVDANNTARDRPRVTWTGALLEKVPFAVVASVFAFLEAGSRETAPLKEIGLGARLTTAAQAPHPLSGPNAGAVAAFANRSAADRAGIRASDARVGLDRSRWR